MKITIEPEYLLAGSPASSQFVSFSRALRLLLAIESLRNMKEASAAEGLSYRHAWNLIEGLQKILGGPVLETSPGRGSRLTELGQRLVWAEKRTRARLGPLLDSISSEISEDIEGIMSRARRVVRMYASHGFAVATLYERLQREGIPLDLNYRGSAESLESFHRQVCDVAGFHVPIGGLEQTVFGRIQKLFSPDSRLINLATRRQGLMVAKGNPKNIWSLPDLLRPEILFVNRQPGSGTRSILELLFAQQNIESKRIKGYDNVEFTHAAIGAYIASGKADVGMGVETGARKFDLDFVPILTERYFFVCRESLLTDARFIPILEILQSSTFHSEVDTVAGYDATNTGLIQTVDEAFPFRSA
ncbi:MAG: substrate-binding domain-containing protein [Burkholderiales bacterium]